MKQAFFAISLTAFIFWGCNNKNPENINSETHEETGQHDEHHHHDEHAAEAIELNDGKKWIVNNEMKPFVEKSEQLLAGFIQDKRTDYKELVTQIQDQNKQLVNSCRMEGKSHDELHKWLHPHLELTKELAKETDPEKSAAIVRKLQESYYFYHEYFQ